MKTLEEMTPQDYAQLGLRSGLEVHQQLDTDTKLFCRCPATHYSPRYDAEILRHMRPTLSELGEYDPTALMEFKTRKEIHYRIARDTVCTYEMDDAPPFELNRQALDIALEIALLLGCKIVGELHIARKQYLDGSIPTGFQRTTILGVDGAIRLGERRIGIRQLALEEDSCREVSDVGHERIYMTDRLSIPLIETVTEPEMYTPWEVAAVGEILRRLHRATGKVRTGAGAGRQDVNVSITGGTRIEIKGVPSIRAVPRLVHYEALRQKALLDIRAELLHRGLRPESFTAPVADVTNLVRHTSLAPVRAAVAAGGRVLAVRLPRFRGILRHPTGPSNGFDRELRGRVRVVACLSGEPNLYHDDEREVGLSPRILTSVRRQLKAEEGDAVVIVWGSERDARQACDEIALRAREALEGVPPETRQVREDGSTRFERVLPGPDRMYPDTDLPPIALTDEHIEGIRAQAAAPPWETEARLRADGLGEQLVTALQRSGRLRLYLRLRERHPDITPRLLATVLAQLVKAMTRRWARHLDEERLETLFALFAAGRFTREAFPDILERLGNDRALSVEAAVAGVVPRWPDGDDWREAARAALSNGHEWRSIACPEARFREAMGIVMNAGLRGRTPGVEVARWLRGDEAGYGWETGGEA